MYKTTYIALLLNYKVNSALRHTNKLVSYYIGLFITIGSVECINGVIRYKRRSLDIFFHTAEYLVYKYLREASHYTECSKELARIAKDIFTLSVKEEVRLCRLYWESKRRISFNVYLLNSIIASIADYLSKHDNILVTSIDTKQIVDLAIEKTEKIIDKISKVLSYLDVHSSE